MKLYPLKFEPHYVPKIWGGTRLQSQLGKTLPLGQTIGESWEIYDRGELSAVVADGPLKGQSLVQLVKEFGPRLLGTAAWEKDPSQFPLLIKLIDASQWLSVQVHPDDDYAALHISPDESGKTEMWYLLDADKDAQLIAGLKPGIDQLAFSKALKEGRLDQTLNRFDVKAGDSVWIPAGRVHAIGAGCLIAEIQQNSDTTYRVYDFDRLENGKPRDLHIQQALETIRFDQQMQALPDIQKPQIEDLEGFSAGELAACEYFRVHKLGVKTVFRPSAGQDCFHVLIGLGGKGTLKATSGESLAVEPGRSLLLPASVDWKVEGACKLLWVRPGKKV